MTDPQDSNIKLKGILMYSKLFQPDTKFKPQWNTVLLLDAKETEKAKARVLRVKKNEDWGDLYEGYDGTYVRPVRDTMDSKGVDRDGPKILDNKFTPVIKEIGIGNGTKAVIKGLVVSRCGEGGTEMAPAAAMAKWGGYKFFMTDVLLADVVPYEHATDPDRDFVPEDVGGDASSGFSESDLFDDKMPFD